MVALPVTNVSRGEFNAKSVRRLCKSFEAGRGPKE